MPVSSSGVAQCMKLFAHLDNLRDRLPTTSKQSHNVDGKNMAVNMATRYFESFHVVHAEVPMCTRNTHYYIVSLDKACGWFHAFEPSRYTIHVRIMCPPTANGCVLSQSIDEMVRIERLLSDPACRTELHSIPVREAQQSMSRSMLLC